MADRVCNLGRRAVVLGGRRSLALSAPVARVGGSRCLGKSGASAGIRFRPIPGRHVESGLCAAIRIRSRRSSTQRHQPQRAAHPRRPVPVSTRTTYLRVARACGSPSVPSAVPRSIGPRAEIGPSASACARSAGLTTSAPSARAANNAQRAEQGAGALSRYWKGAPLALQARTRSPGLRARGGPQGRQCAV